MGKFDNKWVLCYTIFSFNKTELQMATYKQIFDQLQRKVTMDLNSTDEQIELIIKLRQSFETSEEKAKRVQKFREVVAKTQQS